MMLFITGSIAEGHITLKQDLFQGLSNNTGCHQLQDTFAEQLYQVHHEQELF